MSRQGARPGEHACDSCRVGPAWWTDHRTGRSLCDWCVPFDPNSITPYRPDPEGHIDAAPAYV